MPKSELIRNIYFLFCYAWRKLPTGAELKTVGSIESPDFPNLLCKLLINEVEEIISAGVYRAYRENVEESRFVRGRISIPALPFRRTRTSPLICEVEDLDTDVPLNRVIRSTMDILMCHRRIDDKLKTELNNVIQRFPLTSPIALDHGSFARVQFHRGNHRYRRAVFLCELISTIRMPDPKRTGTDEFPETPSETIMAQVFQTFLATFVSVECGLRGRGEILNWHAAGEAEHLDRLPQMHTDLTLTSGTLKWIIDAKYYESMLNERYGKQILHSENLYQLLTYVRHAGPPHATRGMLLYSVFDIDQPVDFRYEIEGYPVQVYGLDLGRSWPFVRDDLRAVMSNLFEPQ